LFAYSIKAMKHINNKVFFIPKITLIALLCFVSFSILSYAQDGVIRVDTDLVTIPATVLDREGRYVTNLRKEDFQIFEDGIEQEVALFEPTVKPFTALLLFDNSGSMRNYIGDLARAANAFVKQMRLDDELIVATFSDKGKIQIILEATKKRNLQQNILFKARIGDSFTTTFDAVEKGIEYIKSFQGRKAIVLFSDGELYGTRASAKSNLRDAEEQEALIYTIRFGAYPTHQPGYVSSRTTGRIAEPGFLGDRDRFGNSDIISENDLATLGKSSTAKREDLAKLVEKVNSYMNDLAQRTGGRSFHIDEVANLEAAFRAVAGELGQQYVLGYSSHSPGKGGERRKISVKVNMPNVAVRSRNEVIYKKFKN
jgi:VWFA-related protein